MPDELHMGLAELFFALFHRRIATPLRPCSDDHVTDTLGARAVHDPEEDRQVQMVRQILRQLLKERQRRVSELRLAQLEAVRLDVAHGQMQVDDALLEDGFHLVREHGVGEFLLVLAGDQLVRLYEGGRVA